MPKLLQFVNKHHNVTYKKVSYAVKELSYLCAPYIFNLKMKTIKVFVINGNSYVCAMCAVRK